MQSIIIPLCVLFSPSFFVMVVHERLILRTRKWQLTVTDLSYLEIHRYNNDGYFW